MTGCQGEWGNSLVCWIYAVCEERPEEALVDVLGTSPNTSNSAKLARARLPAYLRHVDKGSLCPKRFHDHFQTLDARPLHQIWEQEPIGHPLVGRRRFFCQMCCSKTPSLGPKS